MGRRKAIMPRRVLVSQVHGMGNAINTTPLLSALLKIPGVSLYTSTHRNRHRPAIEVIMKLFPGISGFLYTNSPTQLRMRKWDVLITCAQGSSVPRHCPGAKIISPLPRGRTKCTRHEVEYLMEAAYALGYFGPVPATWIPYDRNVAVDLPRPILACGIGYTRDKTKHAATKHWGNYKYANLAKMFWEATGGTMILLGGKEDYLQNGKKIISLSKDHALSVCGFSFLRSAGILSKCDLFVGNDTGFTHAAGALQIPTLAIFKKPFYATPVRSRPWGSTSSYIVEEEKADITDEIMGWIERSLDADSGSTT